MLPANVAAKAVLDKYDTLGFTPKPTAYLDRFPPVNNATSPNYVIITQRPENAEYMAGLDRIETTTVTLTIYNTDRNDLQNVAKGIMHNGGQVVDRLGLDDALALPNLPPGYFLNKCERINSGLVIEEEKQSPAATPVFRGALDYRVELFFDASA